MYMKNSTMKNYKKYGIWKICDLYREQKHDRVRNRARIGSTDLWRTRSEFVADTGEYIDTDNEYMYYYSAEFVK